MTNRFVAQDWREIADFLDRAAECQPGFAHLPAIVRSVIDSGTGDRLAGCTSMHDLLVVPTPLVDPPYGAVVVRAPSSLHPPTTGDLVRIEHRSVTGHDDVIERPIADAIPLFWRFMIEKYGVEPAPHARGRVDIIHLDEPCW